MNIMFVCTGNTCRSAMAEALFKDLIKNEGIKDIKVFSCGIYAENGDGATYNAIRAMKNYGIDLKSHRAINIKSSKIEDMDIILCATISHKIMVIKMYPNLKDKIFTIKEYAGLSENQDYDINDPWGYDENIYIKCAEEIKVCLCNIIEKLKNKLHKTNINNKGTSKQCTFKKNK